MRWLRWMVNCVPWALKPAARPGRWRSNAPSQGAARVHGVIELEDLAVATSGDYRHYLDVGDARIAHTMDARRCAPVNNAVASVTVLARTCMLADAWATALLVAGPNEGLAMAQRMRMDVLFLLRRAEGLTQVGLGRFGQSADW